jgi:hypothetical protein
MQRAFDFLEQRSDIVQAQPWSELAEIASLNPKRLSVRGRGRVQSAAQGVVDDVLERTPAAPRQCLQLAHHIVIERQGGAHFMMLNTGHHDVNLGVHSADEQRSGQNDIVLRAVAARRRST